MAKTEDLRRFLRAVTENLAKRVPLDGSVISLEALAKDMGVDLPTLRAALDELCRLGYVERTQAAAPAPRAPRVLN